MFTTDAAPGLSEVFTSESVGLVYRGGGERTVVFFVLDSVNASGADSFVSLQNDNASLLVRENSIAPQTESGTSILSLESMEVNQADEALYVVRLAMSDFDQNRNRALYAESDNVTELVMRRGDTASGTSLVYTDFLPIIQNRSTHRSIFAELGAIGGGDFTCQAIYSDRSGSLQPIVMSGDEIPELSDIVPVFYGDGETFSDDFREIVVNASGQHAFISQLEGLLVNLFNNEVVVSESTGQVRVVARISDPVTEIPGAQLLSLEQVAVDNLGRAAFIAAMFDGGVANTNDSAIFVERGDEVEIIAREGSAVPGGAAGEVFTANRDFDCLVGNDSGSLFFLADVDPYGTVLCKHSNEAIELLVRQGDPAPGTDLTFEPANQEAPVLEEVAINNLDQIAFLSGLGNAAPQQTDRGLWATDPTGILQLVVREGDQIDIDNDVNVNDVRTVTSFSFRNDVDKPIDVADTLSDEGILVFSIRFTDTSEGLFAADINQTPPAIETLFIEGEEVLQQPVNFNRLSSSASPLAPIINDAGDVMFPAFGLAGLFLDRETGIEVIGFRDSNAPGFDDGTVFDEEPDFFDFNFNEDCQGYFLANLLQPGDSNGEQSFWTLDCDPVIDLEFVTFGSTNLRQINSVGSIVFGGTNFDSQLRMRMPDGELRTILEETQPAPNFPDGTNINGFGFSAINDSDFLVFSASLTGGTGESALFAHQNGVTGPIVSYLDAVPGLDSSVRFTLVNNPTINNAGLIVAFARLAGPGISSANDDCLLKYEQGAIEILIREGDSIPNSDPELFFGRPDAITAINDTGYIAFQSNLTGDSVSFSNDRALFRRSPTGNLVMIAREGQLAPGEDSVLYGFDFKIGLSDSNQVVFTNLEDTFFAAGIYVTNVIGVPTRLAAEGQLFDIDVDPDVEDLREVSEVNMAESTGNASGRGNCITRDGQVVFSVEFTDNSEGIFVANTLPDFLLGDVNRDGVVDLLDIAPFVELITKGLFEESGDINMDGFVNLLDVQPFIDLLVS